MVGKDAHPTKIESLGHDYTITASFIQASLTCHCKKFANSYRLFFYPFLICVKIPRF